jgi:hypothetical protein
MQHRLARRLASVLVLTLVVVGLPAAPASATPPEGAPAEFQITDAYAKAFVLRTTGRADVVAAMIDRVPSPTVHGTGPVFYTTLYSSPPKWAGWMSDTSANFTHRVYGAFSDFYAQGAGCCDTVGSWVGVGGYGNCGLIQAGVNSVTMQAFFELLNFNGSCAYPSTPVFSVNAGDHMWAYITLDSGNGKWYVQVQDLTLGRYYSNEWSYSPSLYTAEWITEVYGGAVPTNLPGVHFWGARWIDETFNTHDIATGVTTLVKLLDQQPAGGCVVPTGLSGSNDTFDNQRQGSC